MTSPGAKQPVLWTNVPENLDHFPFVTGIEMNWRPYLCRIEQLCNLSFEVYKVLRRNIRDQV